MDDIVIGIDLGTTNSCVSVYTKGRLRILENERGERVTPSFIYFQPQGGVAFGVQAKSMSVNKPKNGIFEVKRLIGRKFDDTYNKKFRNYFPFVISSGVSNHLVISFEQNNTKIEKTPQELCSLILQELKKYAEAKLNHNVNKVVITVPASFNVTQREVTLAAAKDAGFTVLKLLNEPTAAALAYYFDNDIAENHISLVYDLGGGTFDVAILQKKTDNVAVLCVGGDTQLGGQDLDNCILDYIFEILRKDYDYDAKVDPDDKRRLRIKCEEAKKKLSLVNEAVITINGMVVKHRRIIITLTRTLFEEKASKLFKKTIDILHNCLIDSKISKQLIQEVILCGGSTRIPKIQEMISEYFGGKDLNMFVNPDECVAEGAALQAAMLSTSKKQNIEQLEMVDVVPLSLGFGRLGSEMVVIIRRNTKVPTKGFHVFVNKEEDETSFSVGIYEGERPDVRKNRYLGKLSIDGLTAAPPGQRRVTFSLNIDSNGILTAKAKERLSNSVKEMKVNYTRGDKSELEIQNSLLDAAENKEADIKFTNFVRTKQYLIRYLTRFLYNLDKMNLDYQSIQKFCEQTKKDLINMEVEQEESVKNLHEEVEAKCYLIAENYKFEYMPKKQLCRLI